MPTTPEDYLTESPARHVLIESPSHLTQRSVLTIFLVAGLLLSTALGFLLYATLHLTGIQQASDRSRDTQARAVKIAGFKNRSVTCAALAVSTGRAGLPKTCLERNVLAFYNPEAVNAAVARSTAATNVLGLRNRAATCEGQYALGIRFRAGNTCISAPVLAYWDPDDPTAYRP